MSPELLDPDQFGSKDGQQTKESDCYALGMTILEVLSGQAPFHYYNNFIVMRKVLEGEQPMRPQGMGGAWFADDLWEILGLCWSPQSQDRPTIETVLKYLEGGLTSWQPPPHDLDDQVQTNAGDELYLTVTNSCMFSQFFHTLHIANNPL